MGALTAWFTGSRFARAVGKWAAIALAVSLFLLSLRRSGERAGRLATDVERVLSGTQPLLMVTDPPYGVQYDPGWRNQAGAAKQNAPARC